MSALCADMRACNSKVLLPTPGSPPMRIMEPGTTPPPNTRATCTSEIACSCRVWQSPWFAMYLLR